MTRERPSRIRGMSRAAIIFAAAFLIGLTAYGPGNLASAFEFHQAPPPPPEALGYLPSSIPVTITAPTARIFGLEKAVSNQRLMLADGSFSPPDTTYLRVNRIELDQVEILHDTGDHKFLITNPNTRPEDAAIAGNADSVVEMWVRPTDLDLCVTPDTFYAIAIGYAGVFGGRLDSLLATIAQVFAQFQGTTLAGFGPCLPLNSLLPVIGVLIDAGVPLPAMLPAANVDLKAYTIKVTTAPGTPAVTAPLANVTVTR